MMTALPSTADVGRAARAQKRTIGAAAVVAFLWAAYLSLWPNLAPASYWLVVDEVTVMDTMEGQTPDMKVSRQIKRPFKGAWIATVMVKEQGGEFSTFCTAPGTNDYVTNAALPRNLNLDWWTWPKTCQLPKGTYRVRTLWVIYADGYPEKSVRKVSNEFIIY